MNKTVGNKIVTQKDVAAAAGVHRSTVTLALKNHPGISAQTTQRIQRLAAKMGYVPDPSLASLSTYRNRHKRERFQGTLAWLANTIAPFDWRRIFYEYYKGATARARDFGYKIEIFDLQSPQMTNIRLESIFNARNISGILIPPQPKPRIHLNFPWERFSAVTFGYTLQSPQLHRVVPAQLRNLMLIMRKLSKMGFERIGFIFEPTNDERVDHNYLAGYLVQEYLSGRQQAVTPLAGIAGFEQWYRTYRPEVVVCSHDEINFTTIAAAGLRVPQDIGVACIFPMSKDSYSGVYESSLKVGAIAVELLLAMLQRGEHGIPTLSQQMMVDGIWHKGNTLLPRKKMNLPVI